MGRPGRMAAVGNRLSSVVVVVVASVLAVACSAEHGDDRSPPPPAGVTDLDPCALLDGRTMADLELSPRRPHTDSHTRSCRYATTHGGDGAPPPVTGLTAVIRHSAAANTVADAGRLVDFHRRAWQPTVTDLEVDGRTVHLLEGDRTNPRRRTSVTAQCLFLFAVDATSSVEFSVSRAAGRRCGDGDLATALARRMPATDRRSVPPPSARATDLFAIDLCALVDRDRRRAIGLTDSTSLTDSGGSGRSRLCRYVSAGAPDGGLTNLNIEAVDFEAFGFTLAEEPPATRREVDARPVVRSAESTAYGGTCHDRYHVTSVEQVEVVATVVGHDFAPACSVLDGLAAVVEPALPLLVVEPLPPPA